MTMCWTWLQFVSVFLVLGWGSTHSDWTADYYFLNLAVHPVCHLPCIPPIQSLSLQFDYRDTMADHDEGLAKVKVDHIHCSCHAVCRATIIVNRSQLGGSAWFTFGKSVLVVHDHLLVLHMTWNGFQKTCSVIIPDTSEDYWPVVSSIFFALGENGYGICLFPVIGTRFNHHVFSKYCISTFLSRSIDGSVWCAWKHTHPHRFCREMLVSETLKHFRSLDL